MHQANREYRELTSYLVPILLFVMVILGYILTEMVAGLWFKPWLLTIGVYYWTLYFPKSIPLWFALVLGLIEDGLAGTPFGLYGIGILLMHYMAFHQRKSLIYSPPTMVFIGFMINLFVIMAVMTLIMWLIGLPLTLWIAMSWLMTSLLFIPIVLLFERLRQKMMRD